MTFTKFVVLASSPTSLSMIWSCSGWLEIGGAEIYFVELKFVKLSYTPFNLQLTAKQSLNRTKLCPLTRVRSY